MSALLPIFLDLKAKPVLLIGGGSVAREKLEKLLRAEADVKVIARDFQDETLALVKSHALAWERREFQDDDADGHVFIISAVNDPHDHARIAATARAKRILINAVDAPAASDCFFAAQVERGPLQLAISTRGLFPGLARSLRLWLEEILPNEISGEFEELAKLRKAMRNGIADPASRMRALREQLAIWNSKNLEVSREQ